jgi:hypothetical protein
MKQFDRGKDLPLMIFMILLLEIYSSDFLPEEEKSYHCNDGLKK